MHSTRTINVMTLQVLETNALLKHDLASPRSPVDAFAHLTKTDDLGKRCADEGIRHKGSKRPQKRGGP